jgi:hypothetical protein
VKKKNGLKQRPQPYFPKQKLKYASLNALQFVTHTQKHTQKHKKHQEKFPHAQNLIKAAKKVRLQAFPSTNRRPPRNFLPSFAPLEPTKIKPK